MRQTCMPSCRCRAGPGMRPCERTFLVDPFTLCLLEPIRITVSCDHMHDARHGAASAALECRIECPCNDRRRILSAFRAYETKLGWEVARWQHNYNRLPDRHRALLPGEPAKYAQALECIQANQLVIK